MKLDRIVIAAVAAMLTLGAVSMTAKNPNCTKKCDAKKCEATTKSVSDPARDPSGAWNQGDEKFSDFLEMWISSPRFRADRSQNAKMATYEDGVITFSDSEAWSSRELFNMAFGGKTKAEMKKNFKPRKTTVAQNQGSAPAESQWLFTDENTMVYDCITNPNSKYGPSETQMIFQRIDGKWQLTGVMMAG